MKEKIFVPYGLSVSVEIIRNVELDNASVLVHAPMYKRKTWVMPHSYKSSQFTDSQIIRDCDFIRVMCKHFPSDS